MLKKSLLFVLIGSMLHGGPGTESSESVVKKSSGVRRRFIVADPIERPSRVEMEKSEKLPDENSPSNDDDCLTLCCKRILAPAPRDFRSEMQTNMKMALLFKSIMRPTAPY